MSKAHLQFIHLKHVHYMCTNITYDGHVYLPLCAAPMRSQMSTEDVALDGDSVEELCIASSVWRLFRVHSF